jgi:dienelactone hydrolase
MRVTLRRVMTVGCLVLCGRVLAQDIAGYNYDEGKIAPYTMLDPLRGEPGEVITTEAQWPARRMQILSLFEENIFGRTPDVARHAPLHAKVIERDDHALGGLAIREQVDLRFDPAAGVEVSPKVERVMRLLVYLPAIAVQEHRRSPMVVGLNFAGNQTVVMDAGILPTEVWSKSKGATDAIHAMPDESTRGLGTAQWQVKMLLQRGYGLATAYYGDLEPDAKGAAEYSMRQLFGVSNAPDSWGAIGVWAWGLSRAFDYLASDPLVDPRHIAVTGHSRLGKVADWAAAQDTRFAAVLSTESGHGGQSIQRRALGETVAHLEHSFPYWFCPKYAKWVGHDGEIPADGNLLLSLIAPRPLYVASAVEDQWSDPHGEFLAAVSASRVYTLLGQAGLSPSTPMPAVDQAIGLNGNVAYHERAGKHDVTAFDWSHYLDFLDARWGVPGTPAVGIAPPAKAMKPASAAQVREWREEMRKALYIPEPLPGLDAEVYSTEEITPTVMAEKVSYRTEYGLRVPAVIYRPKVTPREKMPGIVVVNGHGGDKSSWYAYYAGVLYAQAGAVVVTYDPIGEGERNDEHKDFTSEHDRVIVDPANMPARMGGLMVTDIMQAVGYLTARKDVDAKRVAVMGFSMGSFIASLAGAADDRIRALLLVGGGNLDGVGGYWDASHAVMCQSGPYKALRFMGDRPAVLFTMSARRGDTFVINGTADGVVDIPHHGPEFFAAMQQRVLALNGGEKGVFTTYFDEGAGHRPSWMTQTAAAWLNEKLQFPNWRGKDVSTMPVETIREWAARVSFPLGKSSGRDDRDAGIVAIQADVPLLSAERLDVLPGTEWKKRKDEFVYASWVERAELANRGTPLTPQ